MNDLTDNLVYIAVNMEHYPWKNCNLLIDCKKFPSLYKQEHKNVNQYGAALAQIGYQCVYDDESLVHKLC